MANSTSVLSGLVSGFNKKKFADLTSKCSFSEYLEVAVKNPLVSLSAYQRIYDMIVSKGVEKFKRHNRTHLRYNFFSKHSTHPVYGLEKYLEEFVRNIKGAAGYFGTEKRILLLHGPVGSSKSTICAAIKRGLEEYSETPRGTMYSFDWINLPTEPDDLGPALELKGDSPSPMNDDPLKLIPKELRPVIEAQMNSALAEMKLSDDKDLDKELHRIYKVRINGELNPQDNFFMEKLLERYKGDWQKVVENHIRVKRIVLSEAKRIGIGTFQPKDEKNQDSTELNGDVNYRKLGQYGTDSDPRAFSFDGEFEVAHRGMLEMIEMLKLNQEFLYDLLGAAQERQIKPKKFGQVSIDIAIISHTNDAEYQRLAQNEQMEALRDRTIKVSIPYLTRWEDEIKVYQNEYNPNKVRQHIAPHTLEIAALFAVITRLKQPKDSKMDLVKKAKLYNGQSMPGYTDDSVKELMDQYPDEGLDGISARFIQNKISNALVSNYDYVNPFMVFHEIREGLKNYVLIGTDQQKRAKYEACVDLAKKELDEILKTEVMEALVMDNDAIHRTFTKYIDYVYAYIDNEKVEDEYTGEFKAPDERFMRSIEEKIEVPEQGVNDFRRMIASYVGKLRHNQGPEAVKWDCNPQLAKALQAKMFDDVKDTIKLSSLSKNVSEMIDPETQAKIEGVKQRLIKNFGYNERSAGDVLAYTGSIFARGDIVENS